MKFKKTRLFLMILLGFTLFFSIGCKTFNADINLNNKNKITYYDGRYLSKGSYVKNDTIHIIFDEFYLDNGRNLQNDISYALQHNITHITLRMANGGGSILVLYHVVGIIKQAQIKGIYFTAVAEYILASAAVPVFVICNDRIIAPWTMVMMHPLQGSERSGNISTLQQIDLWEERYAEIMVNHTSFTKNFILELLRPTTLNYNKEIIIDDSAKFFFTTEEAINYSIADRIGYFGG